MNSNLEKIRRYTHFLGATLIGVAVIFSSYSYWQHQQYHSLEHHHVRYHSSVNKLVVESSREIYRVQGVWQNADIQAIKAETWIKANISYEHLTEQIRQINEIHAQHDTPFLKAGAAAVTDQLTLLSRAFKALKETPTNQHLDSFSTTSTNLLLALEHLHDIHESRKSEVLVELDKLRHSSQTSLLVIISSLIVFGIIAIKLFDNLVKTSLHKQHLSEKLGRENAIRTNTIMNNITESIITFDFNGIVQTCNPAAIKTFGYRKYDLIGHNIVKLAAAFHTTDTHSPMHQFMLNRIYSLEGRRKNGSSFPMEFILNEIILNDETHYVASIRDISERKRLEKAKDEFLSTITHELRTPLTAIKGSLGLALGGLDIKIDSRVKSILDIASANTDRLILLINDILDVQKIESNNMEFFFENCSLSELARECIEDSLPYAEKKGVSVIFNSTAHTTDIKADAIRIRQVISNLLSNAIKFSHEGHHVVAWIEQGASNVTLFIKDQGRGIPDSFRKNIFTKFAQLDSSDTRSTGGTGLGLNISKAIINRHGGEIGYTSRENAGSTFYFSLPIKRQNNITSLEDRLNEQTNLNRILLCLTNPDTAATLQTQFKKKGHVPNIAQNKLLMESLATNVQHDLIILDSEFVGKKGRCTPDELSIILKVSRSNALIFSSDNLEGEDYSSRILNSTKNLKNVFGAIEALQIKSEHQKIKILFIENTDHIALVMSEILKESADVFSVFDPKSAKLWLKNNNADLIIIDQTLMDEGAQDIISGLDKNFSQAPILLITRRNLTQDLLDQSKSIQRKKNEAPTELKEAIFKLTGT